MLIALSKLAKLLTVDSVNVTDADGIITHSTDSAIVGTDIRRNAQLSRFQELLDETTSLVVHGNGDRIMAGLPLPDGGLIEVGYGEAQYQENLAECIDDVAKNRHIMEKGTVIVLDRDGKILSIPDDANSTDITGTKVPMLDLHTGLVQFANAGHNPPVLIRNGTARFLEMKVDLILGIMEDSEYETQTLQLQEGDILLLYTDGVTEAVSSSRELFGEKRLLALLSEAVSGTDDVCRTLCRRVSEAVEAFADGAPQADDITMLCLCYRPPAA